MAAVLLCAPIGRLSLAAQYAVIESGNYSRSDELNAFAVRRGLQVDAWTGRPPAGAVNYAAWAGARASCEHPLRSAG